MSGLSDAERLVVDRAIEWVKNRDAAHLLKDAVLAVIAEREARESAANEVRWFAATLADVRNGDTVRPPGRDDSSAVILSAGPVTPWHAAPTRAAEWRPNEHPAEWASRRIVMRPLSGTSAGEALPDPVEIPYAKLDHPVEIALTVAEFEAIMAMGGWAQRLDPPLDQTNQVD